jgi:hypothetical protein
VSFTLVGQPFDAWLDETSTETDPSTGQASVHLHAPSQATTFHVRASLLDAAGAPGPSAERAVAVSKQGFGSVRVQPVYSGHRTVSQWTASVAAATRCKDLTATLPAEPAGALTATAPGPSEPLIANVPAGPNLAVVVRAGHFAWGCADSPGIVAGQQAVVSVTVVDKPLDLTGANVALGFTYDAEAALLAPLLADAATLLGEAFIPGGSNDGSVVLNAMEALTPAANAAAFALERIDRSWDAIAAQHFAGLSPGLRPQLELWAAAGLAAESPSIAASLAAGPSPAEAAVTVTRFGSEDAAAAGVAPGAVFLWGAQPGDTVLLSGSLVWEPSRFAGAAALGPAQADVPAASSVADALGSLAACPDLAAALGPFGTCDVACVAELCGAAIAARFTGALSASSAAGLAGSVNIKATGSATIDDNATATGVDGHFIGTFSEGAVTVTVDGDVGAPPP